MRKPLCIDLFCGMFGWSRPWLEFGGYVVGFDVCHEPYHGPVPKGADLVLQDVRTLHGSQFRHASLILASSPCPEYSYMAMPWKRAKQIGRALRGQDVFPEGYQGSRSIAELNDLFYQPQRIQREAIEAAGGRFIPLIQENVRGAIPWVGRSQWHYGSYHLWGDVPALMPLVSRAQKFNPDGTDHGAGSWFAIADSQNRGTKVPGLGAGWRPPGHPDHKPGVSFNTQAERHTKNAGGSWFNIGSPGQKVTNQNPVHALTAATKGPDGGWFNDNKRSGKSATTGHLSQSGSKSKARKAASAAIAEIPFELARYIAETYYPRDREAVA